LKALLTTFIAGCLVLAALFAGCARGRMRPVTPEEAGLQMELLAELNRLRANPRAYVPILEEHRQGFSGNRKVVSQNVILLTQEGVKPVDEAIGFLRKAAPVPALILSSGMSKAARDHVLDLGPEGKIGHFGTDGSSPGERLQRYGKPVGWVAENIGFGDAGARNMVTLLLVDDGVPDRGHRQKMLSGQYKRVGIACGAHKTYRHMCVIDFAEDYLEGAATSPGTDP
jgi:uncharacterized protein YkwD